MASSPAGRQNLYPNSRDYPGCMGGLMHLFDFNHAVAGRKMLTDKKSGAGLGETAVLDAGRSFSEAPPPKPRPEKTDEESPYGHESQRPPGPRKSNGMPIRALIAQDLTKELDSKNRSPSVVARLMGLEALPENFKAPSKRLAGKVDEKFMQKPPVERQHHSRESAMNHIKMYPRKAKASSISSQITPKSSQSGNIGSQHRSQGSESPGPRNQPREQQLEEFKKEFEAWQTQKSWNVSKRSSKVEDKQVWTPTHQSPSSHNVNIREERLNESKEFQDALDFLQSNKEFFKRFLHEPNSLFARRLQENESEAPVEQTRGIKYRRPPQTSDSLESLGPSYWARESPSSRHFKVFDSRDDSRPCSWSHESPFSRNLRDPVLTEKATPNYLHSPMANNEESARLSDQRSYQISPASSHSRSPQLDCQVPTRIVVLKPSPGRVRNVNSTTPAYVRSPSDHISFDDKHDNTNILEQLREKLRKDSSSGYNKSDRKNGMLQFSEQYRKLPKDPREIAREIARQVRENITRDLTVDRNFIQTGARKKASERKQRPFADLQGNASLEEEPQEFSKNAFWDSHRRPSRSSSQPGKFFGFEVMQSTKDQKAAMIEQVKKRVSDTSPSQVQDFGIKNAVLGKNNSHVASHCESSQGLLNSRQSCQFTSEGLDVSQPYNSSLSPNPATAFSPKLKLNDIEEQREASVSQALPVCQSDEAKCVAEVRLYEVAESVGPDITVLNEANNVVEQRGASLSEAVPICCQSEELMHAADVQLHEVAERVSSDIVFDEAIEAVPVCQSEEVKCVAEVQSHEVAERVSPDNTVFNEAIEAERPLFLKEDSSDLTISVTIVDCNKLAKTETERTDGMMAGPHRPELCNEMSSMKSNQEIDGAISYSSHGSPSLDKDGSVDCQTSSCADDFTKVGTFLADDPGLEPFEHLDGHNVDYLISAQSLESKQLPEIDSTIGYNLDSDQVLVSPKIDLQAHLDRMPVYDSATSSSICDPYINVDPANKQLEQPSPVSVLDLPQQEDSSIATEFEELSSDLEELRMRLRLLSSDTSSHDLDNVEGLETEMDGGSENIFSIMGEKGDSMENGVNNSFGNAHIDVADWKGKNPERWYIGHLLAASGLIGDSSSVLTHWYAPGQPLNPCLLQNLEKVFLNMALEELPQTSSKLSMDGVLGVSRRHLLFDRANEVLLDVLGPYINRCVWSCLKISPSLPTGKDLVELVWGCVLCSLNSHSDSQETLENLVTRDLGNHSGWLNIGAEIEARGFDVEKAILDDLIEEMLLVI